MFMVWFDTCTLGGSWACRMPVCPRHFVLQSSPSPARARSHNVCVWWCCITEPSFAGRAPLPAAPLSHSGFLVDIMTCRAACCMHSTIRSGRVQRGPGAARAGQGCDRRPWGPTPRYRDKQPGRHGPPPSTVLAPSCCSLRPATAHAVIRGCIAVGPGSPGGGGSRE
jgi:hypothetical protein